MQGHREARQEHVREREGNPTFIAPTLFLYVDDGRITVHSDDLKLNTRELGNAFGVCELMHHTWRRRDPSTSWRDFAHCELPVAKRARRPWLFACWAILFVVFIKATCVVFTLRAFAPF
ncbi:hypothetical protein AURDEDRAFT_169716 [Auricularia subglabra TFB-10046 SS5]|nr:hypothetical protein AURDEDRAFT_169716 [Auricularia subglabra TFB-10046 SS5]